MDHPGAYQPRISGFAHFANPLCLGCARQQMFFLCGRELCRVAHRSPQDLRNSFEPRAQLAQLPAIIVYVDAKPRFELYQGRSYRGIFVLMVGERREGTAITMTDRGVAIIY